MKRLLLRMMRGCGMFGLTRAMTGKHARVLMYHNFCADGQSRPGHVSQSALRVQLEYLNRHFRVLPLQKLLAQLRLGQTHDQPAVALTIDDGRRNCYSFLFPMLRRLKMPATFFVVSSFIRGEDWIWTDKILWLSEQLSRPAELGPGQIDSLFTTLNRMRPEKRNAQIRSISRGMGLIIPDTPPPKYAPCTWDELREMADSGLVEIGSHTVSHPILAALTDEESWQELTVSRDQIEQGIGGKITSFCVPNGKTEDYRPSQMRQVKNAGYTAAVLAEYGMLDARTDPYAVPRIGVSGETDPLLFSKYVDGLEHYQSALRNLLERRRRSLHSVPVPCSETAPGPKFTHV